MNNKQIEAKWNSGQGRESATIKAVQAANLYKNSLSRTLLDETKLNFEVLDQFKNIYGIEEKSEKILKRIVHELADFSKNIQTINLNFDNFKEHPGYKLGFFEVKDEYRIEFSKEAKTLVSEYIRSTTRNHEAVNEAKSLIDKTKIYTFDKTESLERNL
jgi:hypothetical protein